MPRIWNDTIEEHRQAVREAALNAVSNLVAAAGFPAVTMTKVAAQAGIGRATLYKYFPDVDSLLQAWHQRLIGEHLAHLEAIRAQTAGPRAELEAVLEAYALMHHHRGQGEVPAFLHQAAYTSQAQLHLQRFIQELLAAAAASGSIRNDAPPAELATYVLNALNAAISLPSPEAVQTLVTVVLDGLTPRPRRS